MELHARLLVLCGIVALNSSASAAPFVPPRNAQSVAFSPDNTLVAVGISGQSDEAFPPRPHPTPRKCGVIQWYRTSDGHRLHRRETFGDLTRVAFSVDNTWLAASRLFTTPDGIPLNEVRVWDVQTGDVQHVFDRCQAFAFGPRGRHIYVASRRSCVRYDLRTGAKLARVADLAAAHGLALPVDGEVLAGIVGEHADFTLRVCSTASGQLLAQSDTFLEPFYTVVFAPSGEELATGHMGRLVIWNRRDLVPLQQYRSSRNTLQHPFYSPDESMLAAGDQQNGDVSIWRRATGERLHHYTFQEGRLHTYHARVDAGWAAPERDPRRFMFSSDSRAFLAGAHGGIIRSVETGQDILRFGK